MSKKSNKISSKTNSNNINSDEVEVEFCEGDHVVILVPENATVVGSGISVDWIAICRALNGATGHINGPRPKSSWTLTAAKHWSVLLDSPISHQHPIAYRNAIFGSGQHWYGNVINVLSDWISIVEPPRPSNILNEIDFVKTLDDKALLVMREILEEEIVRREIGGKVVVAE